LREAPAEPVTEDIPTEDVVEDVTPPVGAQDASRADAAPEPGQLVLVAPQWTGAMKVQVGNQTYDLGRNRSMELPPNTYTAHYSIDEGGYRASESVRINLEAGSTRRITPPIPEPGGLSVRPLPGRAQGRVLLGTEDLGSSPIRRRLLAPGSHRITIRSTGDSETSREIEIRSGQETVLSFDLAQGRVLTSSKPLSR
jgi:hypothetical protein